MHQRDNIVTEVRVVKLVGLWRYPVKSLQGERLESAVVAQNGLVGDRLWGIRDERTGRILTARRRPELLSAAAAYDSDLPVITLPEGRVVGAGPRHRQTAVAVAGNSGFTCFVHAGPGWKG